MGLTINFNITGFIAINTDQRFHINTEENVTIKQVRNFKYLGVSLSKRAYSYIQKILLVKFLKE